MKEAIWTYVDSLDDDGKVQFFQRGVPYKRLTLEQIMFRGASWRDFKSFAENVGWKPVEAESIAFPSGAVLKTQSGQIVDRVEPEKLCEPLTWNTRTPFDPFKGYEVFSGFEDYTCPTQDHPTQRLGEASDPLHASAFLKG